MGLFDNLFLDQNTPVTINDGIDHSKDVVDTIIPPADPANPYPHGRSSGAATGDDKKDPKDDKKDESVSDLFVADKKDEIEAEAILHPPDEQDIALEIGHGPILSEGMPPADPTLGSQASGTAPSDLVSFDIGGDISFDIGGDVSLEGQDAGITSVASLEKGEVPIVVALGTPSETPSTLLSPMDVATTTTPEGVDPATSPTAPTTGSLPSTVDITLTQDPQISDTLTSPAVEIATSSPPPAMSEPSITDQVPATATVANGTTSSVEQTVPVVSSESNIFDLIGGATPAPAPTETPTPTTEIKNEAITSPGSTETPLAHLISGASTMAAPLREKLYSYVDELKGMQIHDKTHKSHKMNQIEVLEERIREIDQEALARKKVIRREIDMLYQEIASMEKVDEEVEDVVSSFEKGFEIV